MRTKIHPQMQRPWLAAVLVASLLAPIACSAVPQDGRRQSRSSKPQQEVFDQAVVEIHLDYEKEQIKVEPETAEIYFQWKSDRQDPLKAVQARWVVRGLQEDHILFIVPKEDAPKGVFPIPDEYRDRRAYRIDGKNNSIRSGEVRELPELAKDKGYKDRERQKAVEAGDYYTVSWKYDVIVTDREGKVLLRVDPEIKISGHP